jgi:hypothetical protein
MSLAHSVGELQRLSVTCNSRALYFEKPKNTLNAACTLLSAFDRTSTCLGTTSR